MLKDDTARYYRENANINCAEAMLQAINQKYQLGLDKKALATMSTFGGGMGVGSVCGALTGGLAAVGTMANEASMDKAGKSRIAAECYQRFTQKCSSDLCPKIKAINWDEKQRCEKTVSLSGEVFEAIINTHFAK